jgi:ABC-type multidrug transport system fused ATPase/permease subunit
VAGAEGTATAGRASAGLPPQEPPLSPELAAALAESPSRPGRELLRLLHGDGVLSFAVLGGGLAIAAGSVILEALLLRSLIDIGHDLGLVTQRLEAASCFLVFALALLLIERRVGGALLRLGRRLETRLRLALLAKIPRLVDRYFQSRPVSDMVERSHSIHQLRLLPRLGGQLVRAVLALMLTGAALVWLYPAGAFLASLAVLLAVGLPLLFKPHLEELDLRVRTHTGALGRFYLDALLGLTTVRAHSAERAVRREHESLLVEWTDASFRLIRSAVTLEGLQAVTGLGLAAWLLFGYADCFEEPAGALLLAYWALYLPVLGEEIVLLVRQYPSTATSPCVSSSP